MGFKSSNFGFKDALSLAATGKKSMGEFYRSYFPEDKHKLNPPDIKQAEDYLEKAFSDNISVTGFPPMVEGEKSNPTFKHPPNLSHLNRQEKADNMIKLLCMSDFSSHYFKEASLQKAVIEEQQENEFPQSDKEVMSTMGSINLDDVQHMEAGTSKN